MSIDYQFKPPAERDGVNGEPQRVPLFRRVCCVEDCQQPTVVGSKFCADHWHERQKVFKAEIKLREPGDGRGVSLRQPMNPPTATVSIRRMRDADTLTDERVAVEPVRYQPTPVDAELYEARQRFPLVPQMSDEELLHFHRTHPRGWYESEASDV